MGRELRAGIFFFFFFFLKNPPPPPPSVEQSRFVRPAVLKGGRCHVQCDLARATPARGTHGDGFPWRSPSYGSGTVLERGTVAV